MSERDGGPIDLPVSLRDYFAAHAPDWARQHYYSQSDPNCITWRWKYADAMLAERQKGKT